MKKNITIEGLRGIACLIVLFNHFNATFFPSIISFIPQEVHFRSVETIYQQSPLALISMGEFGVCIFLIITGYLAGKKFLRSQSLQTILTYPISRYFRLLPIILLGNIFSFMCVALHWTPNHLVGSITHSSWWLQQGWNFPANLHTAILQTFVLTFISNIPFHVAYNPVLWPIPLFFLGSIAIAVMSTLIRQVKQSFQYIVYAVILIASIKTLFFPVIIGLLFAACNPKPTIRIFRFVEVSLLIVICYLGSFPTITNSSLLAHTWFFLPTSSYITPHMSFLYHTMAAAGLFYLCITSTWLSPFFSHRILVQIGSLSYPLYVLSVPVLFSGTSTIFLLLYPHLLYPISAIISGSVSIGLLILVISLIQSKPSMKLFTYLYETLIPIKPTNEYNVFFDIATVHEGHHHVTYKGIKCLKCPFDYVMYQMLLWELKPDLIIEIGTLTGGGTLYLADILDTIGKGTIHSIDIKNQSDQKVKRHKRIKLFYKGWQEYPLPDKRKFKKIMVIDDGAHTYEQVRNAFEKFAPLVSKGSYYIIEDGILTKLKTPLKYHGGPVRAIKEFLSTHPQFSIDNRWINMFGTNATFNILGYLRRDS